MNTRDKVLEILNDIDDSVDYEHETRLIDDRVLDSFAILQLISDLEDAFDIKIDPGDLSDAAHFNTVDAIVQTVERHL